jgi:hypothetical protein
VSVKEELHELVERLGDERASEALTYLRSLLREGEEGEGLVTARLNARTEPLVVSGREFFSRSQEDLATLVARQGVPPVNNLDDLVGGFWPEDEAVDDFIAAVRQWRREGGDA